MKIEGTKPRAVSGVAPLRPRQTRAGAAQPEAAAPVKQDSISIMGIPEPELTPKVREALMALMAEVESMRRDLQEARERLVNLERLADRDPLIPVANRRAFVRELTRTMAYSDRYGHASSVVYIDLND
ncbi:MAG: GGDEF domain-containing protein, partial [Proteobacteria bacterium]|nr:GGDEF domain-containing protein [Pseudomonadota bacterium]